MKHMSVSQYVQTLVFFSKLFIHTVLLLLHKLCLKNFQVLIFIWITLSIRIDEYHILFRASFLLENIDFNLCIKIENLITLQMSCSTTELQSISLLTHCPSEQQTDYMVWATFGHLR